MKRNLTEKKTYSLMMLLISLLLGSVLLIGGALTASSKGLVGERQTKISLFDPLSTFSTVGDIANSSDLQRFADIDLYDSDKAKEVADYLDVNNVVPVPRKYAYQDGKPLDQQDVEIGNVVFPNDSNWTIEGEYAFVPTFSDKTEVSVYYHTDNGYEEEKIYEIKNDEEQATKVSETNSVLVAANQDMYIRYTNLGFYKGAPVTIMLRPSNINRQVRIGLVSPNDAKDEEDVFMSISGTGINSYNDNSNPRIELSSFFNHYESNYIDINYTFYNSNYPWDKELRTNERAKMKIRGFYTYGDFDFEESIGIKDDIDIHSIYVLQAGKDPHNPNSEIEDKNQLPIKRVGTIDEALNVANFEKNFLSDPKMASKYENDPLGIKVLEGTPSKGSGLHIFNNQNPFQQYLFQYMSETSNYMNQLSFVKQDGYRYFNRGTRTDTKNTRVANWLSFTYEETDSFSLRINASALEDFEILANESFRALYLETFDDPIGASQGLFAPEVSNKFDGYDEAIQADMQYVGMSKMFYKIVDKKLEEMKKIKPDATVSDVLVFQSFERKDSNEQLSSSNYEFIESVDGDKVVVGYMRAMYNPNVDGTDDRFINIFDFKEDEIEYAKMITEVNPYPTEVAMEKRLTSYYYNNFEKYKKQQIANSTEEKLLNFLYEMITTPKKGHAYSVYGFNEKNIGNFYSANDDDIFNTSIEANADKANTPITLLDTGMYYNDFRNDNNRYPRLIDLLLYPSSDYVPEGYGIEAVPRVYSAVDGHEQSPTPYGSNIQFKSDTLLPIGFAPPVKQVYLDDEKREEVGLTPEKSIVWEIIQGIPPRIVNNTEPLFVFEDTLDPGLIYEGFRVSNIITGVDETAQWESKIVNNKLTLNPKKDHLGNQKFYNRNIRIQIETRMNETYFKNLTEAEFNQRYEMDGNYLVVKNIGKFELAPRKEGEPNQEIYTRPDYGIDHETKTPSIGKLRPDGNLKITKVAEEDETLKLPNASFELRTVKDDSSTKVASGTTNSNGYLEFNNVLVGEYWLVETKPPNMYQQMEPIKIVIQPFDMNANSLIVTNKKARLLGTFDSVTKNVYNAANDDIDKTVVAFDQEIDYEFKVTQKNSNDKEEITKVYLEDTLDKGLEMKSGTTQIEIRDENDDVIENRVLDDQLVWSKDSQTQQDKLNTSSYTQFYLRDDYQMTLRFKAKITHQAGKKIVNQGTVNGQGLLLNNTIGKTSKESNTVENYLGKSVYLRQVVVDPNQQLAIPQDRNKVDFTGFIQLNHLEKGSGDLLNTISVSIPSGPYANKNEELPGFKEIFLSPSLGNPNYNVQVIEPEMYEYVGYTMNTSQSIDSNNIIKEILTFDLLEDGGKYITFYVTPTEKKVPLFYNWDYQYNNFEKSLKVK